PALGDHLVERVAGADVEAFHVEDHRGEGDAEAHERDVHGERERLHLPGLEQVRLVDTRKCGPSELDQARRSEVNRHERVVPEPTTPKRSARLICARVRGRRACGPRRTTGPSTPSRHTPPSAPGPWTPWRRRPGGTATPRRRPAERPPAPPHPTARGSRTADGRRSSSPTGS